MLFIYETMLEKLKKETVYEKEGSYIPYTKSDIESNLREFENEFDNLNKKGKLLGFIDSWCLFKVKNHEKEIFVPDIPDITYDGTWLEIADNFYLQKTYPRKQFNSVEDEPTFSRMKFFNWRIYVM